MLRPIRVALATSLALVSVLVAATSPAHAGGSATGILNNAWIITELGGSVMSNDAQWATLSSGERAMATTATGTAVATTGLATQPKAGGKLGMVLNTVAVLGGLVSLWPGDTEEAPELPMPPTGAWTGSDACGWADGAYFIPAAACTGASDSTVDVVITTAAHAQVSNTATSNGHPTAATPMSSKANCITSCTIANGLLSKDNSLGATKDLTVWRIPQIVQNSDFANSNLNFAAATIVGHALLPKVGSLLSDPGAGTGNPATIPRYIDSTANCRTPGGGLTPITHRHGPFTFDPAIATDLPEVPDLTCPTGTFLESGTRTLHTEGTDESEDVALVEPYVAPPWVEDQMVRFPDCYPATTTMCVLRVTRTAPAPVVDCHAYTAGSANPCADWWTDPQRSTRYDCSFGGTSVGIRRCAPYADTFSVGIIAESDPDPDAEIGDPVPGVDPTPEQTPDLGDCVPNWGLELLNPWWVFKAQACALEWAFVPETSLETRVSAIRSDLELRVPFVWFDGFLSIPAAVPVGGCPDWRVKVPSPSGDGYQLDENVVCESSYTDAIRTARPVLLVFMASLAFWPMIRSVAYASFPILKPVPGGGR